MEDLVQEYLSYLRIERGLAARSIASYERDLRIYMEFLRTAGCREFSQVTRDQVVAYEKHLQEEGYAATTLRRRISAARGFHKFLAREQIAENDPTDTVATPALPTTLPDVLSIEDACRMIDAFTGERPADLRDRAMLEVLYGCGLRASEICGLSLGDLYLEQGFLRVFGKGSKERIVPIAGAAERALTAYLENGRPALAEQLSKPRPDDFSAVFLNQRGKRLTRQSVFNLVRKAGSVIGRDDLHPHTLRHSFATHMLKGGADLRVLQEIMGHADLSTLQIYTHIDRTHLHEEYIKAHPRDKMAL